MAADRYKWHRRQPGETDAQWEAREARRTRLKRQAWEEVRLAAAGQGITLAEASRRLGDPTGRVVTDGGRQIVSLNRLADIGGALGVQFRLTAIPDTEHDKGPAYKPRMFTNAQIREIRQRLADGESNRQVARAFGAAPSTISKIRTAGSYTDVDSNGRTR